MRPQFHHVDAITHAETAARRTEASETSAQAAKQPQALALAQTYKDNRDVENLEALRAKNLLLIAQEEKWTRLEYFDEDVSLTTNFHLLQSVGPATVDLRDKLPETTVLMS